MLYAKSTAYLANALQKLGMCVTVVKLDCLDLGQVEQVTHELIVGNSLWECRLGDQFQGLIVQVVVDVVAQQ